MSELYNIINEFDINLSNDDDEKDGGNLDFDKEFGSDRHNRSMGVGDDGELNDFPDDDEDSMRKGRRGMGDYDEEDMDGSSDSEGMGDYDDDGMDGSSDEDMFGDEKKTDITYKLKQMLQRRGALGDEEGESSDGEELPDLDDLDLDLSADSDYAEDDEDPDFDYDAFDEKPRDEDDEEDESREFDFSSMK